MKRTITRLACGMALILLSACGRDAPDALGTLERDRITLPAPAAERIVAIDVREGQPVKAGERVMQLEPDRTGARLDALQAQVRQAGEALAELEAGPRSEAIDQARAQLAAARAQAADAQAYYARVEPLGQRQLVSAAEVDRARAAAGNAGAQVRAAQAALLELEHGTRAERLAQGRAAEAAASAEATAQRVTLEKLSLVAPRDAIVESLPYKLGDQAPPGAPLAVLLVGDAPHARVYVPEPVRAGVHVGQRARVRVEGVDAAFEGRVRMIRSEPSFTPYYALTGEDAARLSYLAEIALEGDAARGLPVGLPVQVEFVGDVP
ncbi:HlyD family secretion protein [Marilutibacter chinensis]|uniref:HlyD family efflux transporter periplasmic adaptor subunit n=1 Tax=Marilutibacter chinensis TaxID=2912247 RepID=A0ABS9HVS5_9GAMM|nr:HlyD family efflux transporter periplasmic adaptor subunit [Lysobacter chinensis]MCF7222378.1 HlyD family efflux transporter periplasmic adaptor subunit [Lysobacter chinensis]